MSENTFPIKPNEIIVTAFGNKIFGVNDNEVEIHFKGEPEFTKVITKQNIAGNFYHFEKRLKLVNPTLNNEYIFYKDKLHCVAYSKNPVNDNTMTNQISQRKMIWVVFMKTSFIIQFEMSLNRDLRNFANANSEEFYELYNSSEKQLNSLLSDKNNPDRRHINKINLWNENHGNLWLNFHHVNTEPFPLILKFIQELSFIKPII